MRGILIRSMVAGVILGALAITLQARQETVLGVTLRACGNEGESGCGLFARDGYNGVCDSGLAARTETCGCLLRGPFGGCLLPQFCRVCRNATRHRSTTTAQYAGSWADWALRNQRDQLAVDEPVNWVMRLATHNAFNSFSDGHRPVPFEEIPGLQIVDAPNQFYSMTDQLNLGSRVLAIDAHWVGAPDNARLCHSETSLTGGDILDRYIEEAVCRSPGESGVFGLRQEYPSMRYFANGIKEISNWLRAHADEILIIDLENRVGTCSSCSGGEGAKAYITAPFEAYLGPWLLARTVGKDEPFPSRAELLSEGKRVIVLANQQVAPAHEYYEGDFVSGAYPAWTRNRQNFDACTDTGGTAGPAKALSGQFTVIVEDRTLQQGFLPEPMGHIEVDDMRRVAKCNFSVVATDFLGSSIPLGRSSDRPDFSRHEAAVWSWKPGDKGQNGRCAMVEGAAGRWASAACSESHHYVCGPPRSESGTDDRTGWRQLESRWRITTASGPWADGADACAAEFPFDPSENTSYVFSVPVNGFQNEKLRQANAEGVGLWLNYTNQSKEDTWVIPKIASVNTPPVADAGPDQRIECGGDVTLSGAASIDADGDPLTYSWTGPFGTVTGPSLTTRLARGTHAVSLTVQDGKGGSSTDTMTVAVRDTTDPDFTVALSPSVLSPDDGEMVTVTADVAALDACDGDDVRVELRSIVSSEPDDAGSEPDVQDAQFGVGDLEFSLRAERSHPNSGRLYTVTYRAWDRAGNSVRRRTAVVVEPAGQSEPERAAPARGSGRRVRGQ